MSASDEVELPESYFALHEARLDDLTPHPQNYREHSEEQIEHLAESIRQFGLYRNIVIADDNVILAGHGVAQAAQRIGIDTVPVVKMPFASDSPSALKILVLDNTVTRLAVDDDIALAELLSLIRNDPSVGLLGTGFDESEIEALRAMASAGTDDVVLTDTAGDESDPNYSRIVESPVYEITGEKPSLDELVDIDVYSDILERIYASSQTDQVKRFLRYAAARHLQFNYGKIAEFYAHADAETQALMEESALVIVDVDRAIELGFARLAEDMRGAVRDAEESADDDE